MRSVRTLGFECGEDIMLVDAGLAFPSVDMIGVDIVLPKQLPS